MKHAGNKNWCLDPQSTVLGFSYTVNIDKRKEDPRFTIRC